ncbi:MAG TPA: hypothetical protein VI279_06525 [Rhodocyclaceae bacterium]
MRYHCTPRTDLDDLIGQGDTANFEYGPLCQAMKSGEELVLEDAASLPIMLLTKLDCLCHGLVIAETGERIVPDSHFHLRFD